ncbi:MAG: chromate efflux transporter [Pseudobdellovibrio sp.]
MTTAFEIFITFLRLGLTSFGGPVAHLSYFHDEFVTRKKWLSEHAYADLVGLCQFLPGPASSQVGMAIGLSRGGIVGSIAAWLGFTIPSALIFVFFAYGITHFTTSLSAGWLHGLKILAVAVVAQAVLNMSRKLCNTSSGAFLALASAVIMIVYPSTWMQILVIFVGGLLGCLLFKKKDSVPHQLMKIPISKSLSTYFLIVFIILIIALPMLSLHFDNNQVLHLFDSFFRVGSFVFGGGHVVLPLLQTEVVSTGWISKDLFMAGYGLAQAIPGPLFTFSAYLGAISSVKPAGFLGAVICLVAVFLPSFLLIIGVLPFWEILRKFPPMQSVLQGLNATVVGLLLAALYNPVWISAIFNFKDFILAASAFSLLVFLKLPSWAVAILCVTAGMLI